MVPGVFSMQTSPHNQVLELFPHSKKQPCLITTHSSFPPPPSPKQSTFCLYGLAYFGEVVYTFF